MSIIDTPFNTKSRIPCLVSNGVDTVIRYYNFSNSRMLPEKRMELSEAQALASNGIKIAAIFQQRQNQKSDFTKLKGLAAGRRAYRYAQDNIGQPAGSGIYFAVDFDANNSEVENNIAPFFEGIKGAFVEESAGNPEYRIGAYGSGLVCNALAKKELTQLTWLAMSRGFRGTRDALNAGEYHLAQRAPASTLCNIGLDFNDLNPDHDDFGAFTIDDDDASNNLVITEGKKFRVIARSGLRLREGPGTQFDIIGGLRSGQTVFVLSIRDGWAVVDVDGDGLIDGFASSSFLQEI